MNSRMVSSSGHHEVDWNQILLQSGSMEFPKPLPPRRQQQQSEPLNCPRCDSSNTKFCYYNNYNKLQPRHFCKACKRHWTKGGLLRNVPVGGGRKNKRLKTSNPTTTPATTTTTSNKGNAFSIGGQKNMSDIFYQVLNSPQSSQQHDTINYFNGKTNFMGSTILVPQNQNLQFSLSSLSSLDTNPSSISTSFPPMNEYNYIEKLETSMEDSNIMTSIMPTTSANLVSQSWIVPTTGSVMDMPNYLNWNDLDMLSADLTIPWDDHDIKPKGS